MVDALNVCYIEGNKTLPVSMIILVYTVCLFNGTNNFMGDFWKRIYSIDVYILLQNDMEKSSLLFLILFILTYIIKVTNKK